MQLKSPLSLDTKYGIFYRIISNVDINSIPFDKRDVFINNGVYSCESSHTCPKDRFYTLNELQEFFLPEKDYDLSCLYLSTGNQWIPYLSVVKDSLPGGV